VFITLIVQLRRSGRLRQLGLVYLINVKNVQILKFKKTLKRKNRDKNLKKNVCGRNKKRYFFLV